MNTREISVDAQGTLEALTLLGLPRATAAAYLSLLGGAAPQAAEADRLVTLGLAAHAGAVLLPVPPEAALALLTHERAAELARARIAVRNAHEHPAPSGLAETLTGQVMRERSKQAEREAVSLIRYLDSPPHYAASKPNREEMANLARGVRYQGIYAAGSLLLPGYLRGNIIPAIEAGEQARMLPSLPVKVKVVDDEVAFVSQTIAETADMRAMLMVRPGSLLSALVGLVDQCWAAGWPFYRPGSPLCADDRVLLALLIADAHEDRIAEELGVGRRTLYNRLEVLMTRAGAVSRFQLASRAVTLKWI